MRRAAGGQIGGQTGGGVQAEPAEIGWGRGGGAHGILDAKKIAIPSAGSSFFAFRN